MNRLLSKLVAMSELLRRCGARILINFHVCGGSAPPFSSHFAHRHEFRKKSNAIKGLSFITFCLILMGAGCAVTPSIQHQYALTSHAPTQARLATHKRFSILITKPEAFAGYQTEQMLYMKKPYEMSAFAQNGWSSPPAELLMPLIVNSLEATGRFKAIVSTSTAETADYQLDTQLISLHQNFLKHPSEIEFAVKVVLSDLKNNRIIASHVTRTHIACPMDTPYGGVVAANMAATQFSQELSQFVKNKT